MAVDGRTTRRSFLAAGRASYGSAAYGAAADAGVCKPTVRSHGVLDPSTRRYPRHNSRPLTTAVARYSGAGLSPGSGRVSTSDEPPRRASKTVAYWWPTKLWPQGQDSF